MRFFWVQVSSFPGRVPGQRPHSHGSRHVQEERNRILGASPACAAWPHASELPGNLTHLRPHRPIYGQSRQVAGNGSVTRSHAAPSARTSERPSVVGLSEPFGRMA